MEMGHIISDHIPLTSTCSKGPTMLKRWLESAVVGWAEMRSFT